MPLIMNASCVTQTVSVFGNHFTLKPGQVKMFTDHMASFLSTERAENGLVQLPESMEDPEFYASEEGKQILADKKAEGVRNRVRKLKQLAYNETVSLKNDLDIKNLKVDPRTLMDDRALPFFEELASYMDTEDKAVAEKVDKVKALEKRIGKIDKE